MHKRSGNRRNGVWHVPSLHMHVLKLRARMLDYAGWPDTPLFDCVFYMLTHLKNMKFPDFVFSVNKRIVTLKVIETHLNKTEERILSTYGSFMSVSSLSL